MADILVVDDDVDICRITVRLLECVGYDARWVPSGEAALYGMRSSLPRLVLLDVMMPGIGGLEVLGHIRAEHPPGAVAVVMFTAVSDDVLRAEAERLGAQDYLVKGSTGFDKLEAVARRFVGPSRGAADRGYAEAG